MQVNGIEFFVVLFILWIVVPTVIGFVLYLVVRLGVKHGMRSYYADPNRPSSP